MSFLQLRNPSFRSRLRLFFVVIVVVPMVTIAIVLFWLIAESQRSQTEARLFGAQIVVQQLDSDLQAEAGEAAQTIGSDQRLANARARRDRQAIQRRLDALAEETGAAFVNLRLNTLGNFRTGSPPAMAPASRRLVDPDAEETGRLTVAMLSADQYAQKVSDYTHAEVVLLSEDGKPLATTDADVPAELPDESVVEVDGTDYRVNSFEANALGGPVEVALLLKNRSGNNPSDEMRWSVIAAVAFIAFLAIAFIFAVAVSRRLQDEIRRLLEAARRLSGGDFSATVPAEGDDEFGELGKEFNSMAHQLETRLEELQRERGRLQEAIRRIGESVAAGLDRDELLAIVVETAVDGTGASAGRASTRGPDDRLQVVTRAGEPEAFERALHAAEAAAIDAGQIAEVQLGKASALAAPLGAREAGGRLTGIVSIARGDHPFTSEDREQLAWLTNQASVSVENVHLHETVQRQAVTDELTGLFNHRRFQEVMTNEVERARRYGHELGLIMLDIDDFKQVNDTYGHLQGDMVLGEVARVLSQSSRRDIDEPARYGGEEMAVALPQTDLEGAYQFAERVRRRIEALDLPLLNGGGTLRVTASFGVASLATAGTADKDALVAAADGALYEAKQAGKNRTVRASVHARLQRDVHGVASGE
jgi:diguanylate cyclase (GGDEF)-like protein